MTLKRSILIKFLTHSFREFNPSLNADKIVIQQIPARVRSGGLQYIYIPTRYTVLQH